MEKCPKCNEYACFTPLPLSSKYHDLLHEMEDLRAKLRDAERVRATLATTQADLAAAREAVGEMWAALAELVEVAGLRGDSTLPNPCDDPLLWTVRMQEAWDAAEEAVAKHTPTTGAPEVPRE